MIIDVKTRKVRALVGGYASKVARLQPRDDGASASRARASSRSCTRRRSTAGKLHARRARVNDAPEVFDLWKPKNYETGKFEGPVLLRHALAKSINTVVDPARPTTSSPRTIVGDRAQDGHPERAADGDVARARLG